MDGWARGFLGVSLLIAAATGCNGDDAAQSTVPACPEGGCTVESDVDVVYAEDARADVYAPVDQGPWPVVVAAHGGYSDKGQVSSLAEAIAEEGAVVYTPSLPLEPVPTLDTFEHLACAVQFARATAGEHGGDGGHVTIVGFSLGAYAGSVVALSGEDHQTPACVVDTDSGRADAFVGYEGPYDWAIDDGYPNDLPALEQSDPETWRAFNPYAQIGRAPKPTIRLIQGVDDDVRVNDTEPSVAEDFHQALVDAGYDVELTLIDGAPHALGAPGFPQWEAIVSQTLDVASGEPTSRSA